ncbi:MAG: alanyl-tRNA editing protein, partial [Lachnospiraceae bacterium]|nr:alanyl-tRNA editing protein [Lachnospiraceae bacterium]
MTDTLKLFDADAYLTEFDGEVAECTPCKEGYALVLDQTAFFPEEGGQTADEGYLCILSDASLHSADADENPSLNKESDAALMQERQIPVKDVQIRDNVISHIVDTPLEAGTKVHGVIDFQVRYDKMQQHSGEHIFSGTVHQKFGYDNVGFRLSSNVVTMDFNGPMTPEQATEVEQFVNQVIWENIPIECWYPEKAELDALEYRSKKELEGAVRLVRIGAYDLCACCAPHVHRTGEIGLLKITGFQNYKGGVRISINCGKRALSDYHEKQASVSAISGLLSAKQEEVTAAVERLLEENGAWKQKYNQLLSTLLSRRIGELDAHLENVVLFEDTFDPVVSRNAVNEMTARFSGYCG